MDEANYYKQIIHSGKIGILDWDLTQDSILISETLQSMLGYLHTNSDMTNFALSEIFPEKDLIAINNFINKQQPEHKPDFSLQHVMIQKDGIHCWVLQNGTISYDEQGKPIRLVSSVINITEMKIAEFALKESESRYKALFESSNEGLLLLDKDHKTILFANDTIAQMIDFPIAELIKMTFNEITYDDITNQLKEVMQIENSILRDIPLRKSNNEYIYVDINCILTSIDEQEYYIYLIRDVTNRKEYEYALLESKKKDHTYIANAPYGVFIVDVKGNYLEVNQAACEILGYKELDLLLMNIKDILDPTFLDESLNEFQHLLKNGKMDVVSNCITKDGSIIKLSINAVRIDEGRYIAFCQDVTQKTSFEQLIIESEEKFRNLMEQSPISIQVMTLDGKIKQVNSSFKKLWSITEEVMIEVYKKYNILEDEQLKKLGIIPLIENAFSGETVTLPPIEYDAPDTMEALGFKKIEGRKRWIQSQIYPLKNNDGDIINMILLAEDITERTQIKKDLQEREEQFKRITEQSFDTVITINLQGIIQYTSPAITKMFGYDTNELLEKNLLEYVPPLELEKAKSSFFTTSQGKFVNNLLTKFIKKDGSLVEVEVNAAPIYDNDKVIGACGFLKDVTERNRTLQKLKDSEDKYKNITERSFDSIYVLDTNLNLEYISPSMTIHFGHKSEDVIGKSVFDFIPESDYETSKTALQEVLSGNRLEFDRAHILRTDGTVADLEVNVVPIYKSNKIVGVQGMIRDVTERNEAERKLKKAETDYQNLFESAPVSIWREDFSGIKRYIDSLRKEGITNFNKYFKENPDVIIECISLLKIIDINHETVNLLKAKDKQEILSSLDKTFTADSLKTFKHELLCLIDGKKKFNSEVKFKTFENKVIRTIITVYLDSSVDDWSNVIITIIDITDLKSTEQALKESEQKFSAITHQTSEGIGVADMDGNYVYVNPAFCKMSGYTYEELLKMTVFDMKAKSQPHGSFEESRKGRPIQVNLLRKDNTEYLTEIVGNEIKIGNKNFVLGTVRDISERVRIENKLNEERKRAQIYLDMASVMFVVLDTTGIVTLVNQKTCEILGYSEDKIIGKSWFDNFLPERIRKRTRDIAKRLLTGEIEPLEYYENAVLTKNGSERMIAWHNTILRDNKGKIVGHLSSGEDITERQRAENLQYALFSISESVNQTSNIDELLKNVHKILGTLIDTTNFYIALYEKEEDLYSFPYCVDQYEDEDFTPQQLKRSLTDYVRRTEKPIIINELSHKKLIDEGEVELIGRSSPIWLGAPLKTPNGIIGVAVVQSYDNPDAFKKADLYILSFASEQIALAIERKRADERITFLSQVTEQVKYAIITTDLNYKITYVNEEFQELYAYSKEEVLGKTPEFMNVSLNSGNIQAEIYKAVSNGREWQGEVENRKKDGSTFLCELTVFPILNDSGVIFAYAASQKDITERKTAQLKLENAEIKYRTLFESAPVSIWREDFSAIKLHVNALREKGVKDFEMYFNDNPDEIMKCVSMLKVIDINYETVNLLNAKNKHEVFSSLDKVFTLESIDTFRYELICLVENKKRFASETTIKTFDDKIIDVLITVSLDTSDETWSHALISIIDITNIKKTEQALIASEEKYRDLFDESMVAIYLFDSQKNFIDSNQAGLDLLGYTRDELLKMSIPDVDADPLDVVDAHKNLSEGDDLINFEHRLKCKDGTIITVLNNSKPLLDSDGTVICIQSTLLNITKRKQSEKALKESEEKFRAFTNQTTEGITVAGEDGKYIYVNPAFCKMSGYSEDELMNMTAFDMTDFNTETKEKIRTNFIQNMNKMEGVRMNVKLIKKDNTEYFTEILGKIITIGDKKFALGTVRDITQAIKSEELLKESEKKYRTLFEVAQEGILVIDTDSYTTLVNKSMADMLGYSIDEMIGKHLFYFMDETGIEIAKYNIERRKSGIKEQHDFQFLTKEGKHIFTTIETAPIFDDNQNYIGAIAGVMNITERKTAENKLLASKKQYDQILDRSNAVVYIKDLNHKYMYANAVYYNLFNLTADNLLGKSDYDLFSKEQADVFVENDSKVVDEQKFFRVHEKVIHNNVTHTYISDKFPLYDSNGEIYATCGISTDITDVIEAQQKEKYIQQQLVRKDRLINVGQLSAAIAHEINNPMTVLHGSLEEIKESKEALNYEMIEIMLRVSCRIKNIISNLMIFTRQEEHIKDEVDINIIIQNTFLLISNLLHKSSIEINSDLSKENLNIEVNQVQLQQVFINIIFNAMHAMKNGGILKVKSFRHNEDICISFEDNGIGIDEENLKSIFLPFFTTKEVGEGTGLGLSISHGIIEEHGGSISVKSEVNKGSTFTIILPVS